MHKLKSCMRCSNAQKSGSLKAATGEKWFTHHACQSYGNVREDFCDFIKKNKKTELDADRVGELQLHVMGRIKLTFSHQGKAESQSSHLMVEYEI